MSQFSLVFTDICGLLLGPPYTQTDGIGLPVNSRSSSRSVQGHHHDEHEPSMLGVASNQLPYDLGPGHMPSSSHHMRLPKRLWWYGTKCRRVVVGCLSHPHVPLVEHTLAGGGDDISDT